MYITRNIYLHVLSADQVLSEPEGGGGPDAVKFYGYGDCFDVPTHYLPKVFIVRAYNKKHIVNVAC